MTTQLIPPTWAFEFHGHECPFMPIGYRMGQLALAYLGAEKEADHGFFVFPELGEGHPQTCMMDGIQVATGATYGKVMITKSFYGKLAATFYHPKKVQCVIRYCPISSTPWVSLNFSSTARRASSLRKFPWRCARKSSSGSTISLMRRSSRCRHAPILRTNPSRGPSERRNAACAGNTSSTATCA